MDFKLELVPVPVTDVDRAKAFYVDQVGFNADVDAKVSEELRFVQLTPPGSACSIAMGTGITEMAPGSQRGLQVVVADIEAARGYLLGAAAPGPSRGRDLAAAPRDAAGRWRRWCRHRPAAPRR